MICCKMLLTPPYDPNNTILCIEAHAQTMEILKSKHEDFDERLIRLKLGLYSNKFQVLYADKPALDITVSNSQKKIKIVEL